MCELLIVPKSGHNILLLVGWLFGLYDISAFVGYLTPNPFLRK